MLNLNVFFDLLKKAQKPHEDALRVKMQEKVDWVKKNTQYDLTERQKEALKRDAQLIEAVENYIGIQHQVITRLFEMVEQLQTDNQSLLHDKLTAEKQLRDLIQKNYEKGDVQPAA